MGRGPGCQNAGGRRCQSGGGEEGGGGRRQCVPVCGAVRTCARGTLTLLHLERSVAPPFLLLPPAAARATAALGPPPVPLAGPLETGTLWDQRDL